MKTLHITIKRPNLDTEKLEYILLSETTKGYYGKSKESDPSKEWFPRESKNIQSYISA